MNNERLSTPEKQKVIELFGGKTYFFKVPRYQRSYVWSDRGKSEQLLQFWDDFFDTEKSNGNLPFLGNLILSRTNESSVFDVVDGQQRLITLQVFFRTLANVAIEIAGDDQSFKQKIDSIRSTLLSVDAYGEKEERKLIAGKDIDDYLSELIRSGSLATTPAQKDAQWNIWNSLNFFTQKVTDYIDSSRTADDKMKLIMGLFKKIGEVEFIVIILGDQSDAYEVFESFNAKGERLNTSDLFKNLILSKLSSDEDSAYQQWNAIEKNIFIINKHLPQFNLDTYLRYYWSAQNGYISPRTLYREIKDNTTDYRALLKGLENMSEQLAKLLDIDGLTPMKVSEVFKSVKSDPSGKESNKIQTSIRLLSSLKAQQYIVWLLCLLQNWKHIENRKHVANSLKAIESFSVLYFSGGSSSANKIEKIFSNLSQELTNSIKSKAGVTKIPRSKEEIILNGFRKYVDNQHLIPTLQEFKSQASGLQLTTRNKDYLWQLLEKLERSARRTGEVQLDRIVVTVEHLLPQKPASEWDLSKTDIKPYVDLFGNLTLLDFMINGSIQNQVPIKKLRQKDKDLRMKYLDDSEILITQEVVNQWRLNGHVWNEKLIRERHKILLERLYTVYLPDVTSEVDKYMNAKV